MQQHLIMIQMQQMMMDHVLQLYWAVWIPMHIITILMLTLMIQTTHVVLFRVVLMNLCLITIQMHVMMMDHV